MQIVPYMPVHPAQLNTDSKSTKTTTDEVEDSKEKETISDDLKNDQADHFFKIPSVPNTPYTVEEPCDSAINRGPAMKRYGPSI